MLTDAVLNAVITAIGDSLGQPVVYLREESIGGGNINAAHHLHTDKGSFFLKTNDERLFPELLKQEAHGLELMAATNTIRIPKVIAEGVVTGYNYLVLEWISPRLPKRNFWTDFGMQLAEMHRTTQACYGFEANNYIGNLRQFNKPTDKWAYFFQKERLYPQVELAKATGYFTNTDSRQWKNLYNELPNLLPEEQPSLLHGDLWNGNFMADDTGAACIYDPAIYYGHREMDLAMSRLFGGFDDTFYDAYNEAWPLLPGFEQRVQIYNLYPLLVHLNLFGEGYLGDIKSILRRF